MPDFSIMWWSFGFQWNASFKNSLLYQLRFKSTNPHYLFINKKNEFQKQFTFSIDGLHIHLKIIYSAYIFWGTTHAEWFLAGSTVRWINNVIIGLIVKFMGVFAWDYLIHFNLFFFFYNIWKTIVNWFYFWGVFINI